MTPRERSTAMGEGRGRYPLLPGSNEGNRLA
jgi:hypothetical protein